MSWLSLSEIAALAGGTLYGSDAPVESVCTDTRKLAGKQLFIALKGERYDGHDFIPHDADFPAAGVMIGRELEIPLPRVRVDDTLAALTRLAGAWRKRLEMPIVGLTGSNGKTTVKEMIAAILGRSGARRGEVLATQGNLNNHIGVPLTLLAIRPRHACAVVEMGANHPGEIAALAQLTLPQVALIINAGPAHLEGFGDLEGVARAKGEILQGLSRDGIAVLNADDPHLDYWRSLLGGRQCYTFGIENLADVGGRWRQGHPLLITTPNGDVEVDLPLEGRHNALNALAATAVCHALSHTLDLSLADVKAGLEAIPRVHGRLESKPAIRGAALIDDSYNANPGSLAAAIEVLTAREGERWLVLGDMAELGGEAEALHRAAGKLARERGLDRLLGLGPLSRHAVQAFGRDGRHFGDANTLIQYLQRELRPGVQVLVKGSRSMRMDVVAQALLPDGHDAGSRGSEHAA